MKIQATKSKECYQDTQTKKEEETNKQKIEMNFMRIDSNLCKNKKDRQ
jgi:hypothetical protein